jgi:hypothetical protein
MMDDDRPSRIRGVVHDLDFTGFDDKALEVPFAGFKSFCPV